MRPNPLPLSAGQVVVLQARRVNPGVCTPYQVLACEDLDAQIKFLRNTLFVRVDHTTLCPRLAQDQNLDKPDKRYLLYKPQGRLRTVRDAWKPLGESTQLIRISPYAVFKPERFIRCCVAFSSRNFMVWSNRSVHTTSFTSVALDPDG